MLQVNPRFVATQSDGEIIVQRMGKAFARCLKWGDRD